MHDRIVRGGPGNPLLIFLFLMGSRIERSLSKIIHGVAMLLLVLGLRFAKRQNFLFTPQINERE
jgi:hypothetical protein